MFKHSIELLERELKSPRGLWSPMAVDYADAIAALKEKDGQNLTAHNKQSAPLRELSCGCKVIYGNHCLNHGKIL